MQFYSVAYKQFKEAKSPVQVNCSLLFFGKTTFPYLHFISSIKLLTWERFGSEIESEFEEHLLPWPCVGDLHTIAYTYGT